LARVLLHGFSSWLGSTSTRPPTFGSLYNADILAISALYGQIHTLLWYQACHGHFSSKWSKARLAYEPPSNTVSPVHWASCLVDAFWSFATAMWHHHNTIVHGDNIESQASILLGRLHLQVHQFYTDYTINPTIILPCYQHLFTDRTLEQCLNHSYDHLVCWLVSVEEAIAVCEHQMATAQLDAQVFFPGHSLPSSASDHTYLMSSTSTATGTTLVSTNTSSSSSWTSHSSTHLLAYPDLYSITMFSDDDFTYSSSSSAPFSPDIASPLSQPSQPVSHILLHAPAPSLSAPSAPPSSTHSPA
jgi:hypothetical protein